MKNRRAVLSKYGVNYTMKHTVLPSNTTEQNRFINLSDFKTCVDNYGEVEFEWKGIRYSITRIGEKISIAAAYRQETERLYDTADQVLEYPVGEDRLRDVITKATVWSRTI